MKLEDATDYFKTQPLMYLATLENDQPRVRPMALIYHKGQCWCCTTEGRPKIEQIKNNSKMEFALNAQDREDLGTIRGLGKAIIVDDLDTKKEIAKIIPWFSGYWESYKDPKFVLIRLDLELIEAHVPVVREFYTFNLRDGSVSCVKK